MFYWRSTLPPTTPAEATVELGFTGQSAGGSAGPYGGFNLGGNVGDDRSCVESNRAAVAAELGLPSPRLLFMNQVHGDQVAVVREPWSGPAPQVDALVSDRVGLGLGVLVADCVPVLLHDAQAQVVGAVHAGRPGLLVGVVPRALEAMRSLGATAISAAVGPSVCGRCYEVPSDLADRAAAVAPSSRARSWSGTNAIDVAAGVVEQLQDGDVEITWVTGCTRENDDLYSYRRDHVTGRFAGVVLLRERAG